jgi:hypothetical protein
LRLNRRCIPLLFLAANAFSQQPSSTSAPTQTTDTEVVVVT